MQPMTSRSSKAAVTLSPKPTGSGIHGVGPSGNPLTRSTAQRDDRPVADRAEQQQRPQAQEEKPKRPEELGDPAADEEDAEERVLVEVHLCDGEVDCGRAGREKADREHEQLGGAGPWDPARCSVCDRHD